MLIHAMSSLFGSNFPPSFRILTDLTCVRKYIASNLLGITLGAFSNGIIGDMENRSRKWEINRYKGGIFFL